ncbi:MAG: hypothetical protein U0893_18525 [Chloroflexota bacterium]
MEQPRTPSDGPVQVLVVGADPERLEKYDTSLRESEIAARVTPDMAEAESVFGRFRPDAVVLDSGLPRMVLFRLYGLVREDASDPPVKLVFVGQQGDTGPDDHYLPGEPSPGTVLTQVRSLLPRRRDARGSSAPAGASTASASAAASAAVPDSPASSTETPAPAAEAPSRRRTGGAEVTPPPAAAASAAPAAASPAAPTSAAAAPPATAPETDGAGATGAAPSGAAATAEGSAPAPDAPPAPKPPGRRMDVILIRVGLVLLVLGALLFLVRMQAYPAAIEAPPPAPTRRPSPSPSPKPEALLPAPGHDGISAYQIEIRLG